MDGIRLMDLLIDLFVDGWKDWHSVMSVQCIFVVYQLVLLCNGILNKFVCLRRCGTMNWQQ